MAQIPVQQEGHNHQRQHNDGNDHWGDKTENFKDNRGFVTSGNVGEENFTGLSPAITAESTAGVAVVTAERKKKGFFLRNNKKFSLNGKIN